MKTIAISLIAQPDERGAGTATYIRRIFQEIGENYIITDCKFIIYKQKQVSKEYWQVPKDWNVEWIDVPNIGGGFKRVLFEQTFFYKYLKHCDVFYCYCGSYPKYIKAKKVLTQHDIYFLFDKNSYSFIKRLYRRRSLKTHMKQCDKILTVSNYSKQCIMNVCDVPSEKIDITYNFIPTNNNTLVSCETIEELKDYFERKITCPQNFFLFTGRIQHNKNVENTIKGFNKFLSDYPKYKDYHLIIVGKSMYKNIECLDFIKNAKNVIYLGYTEEKVLNYLQHQCKAIALVSMHEGFGIPIIEGFINGKPCLTSNTSCLPEVAGKAGIKVNPYKIDEISKGFKTVIQDYDYLTREIDEQLSKFKPSTSVETFMNALEINYLKKD